MTLKETIGFRITELCAKKGLSPYALAMACGLDKSTIYSILGEKSKSPEAIVLFDFSLSFLFLLKNKSAMLLPIS